MLLNDVPEEYRPNVASISIDGTSATTLIIDRWRVLHLLLFHLIRKTRCETKNMPDANNKWKCQLWPLFHNVKESTHPFSLTKMENNCEDE